MDEAEAVLRRLGRIEALDRSGSPAQELLGELHALVAEAEAWARRERIEEPEAVARCRAALAAEGWPTVAR
ncbi:MAG TPA: hypothetical protein VM290_00135 [Gaiellaceae bacterium]|nr:hypothetical protein [Gaiellaceae bacterium]